MGEMGEIPRGTLISLPMESILTSSIPGETLVVTLTIFLPKVICGIKIQKVHHILIQKNY